MTTTAPPAAAGFDPNAAPAPTPVASMYACLVGVGLACGLLIVTVFQTTAPIIRQNRIEARAEAVLEVVPGAELSAPFLWNADAGRFEPAALDAEGDGLVFAAFDKARKLIGVAVPAQRMGYQDVVKVLYGYAPAQNAVVGLKILESRETPGLGDRVETEPTYVANFAALDVTLAADATALANPIQIVKPGDKDPDKAWQIDTISGATITSNAVARMVADSAATWVPRLHARQADFTPPETAPAGEEGRR